MRRRIFHKWADAARNLLAPLLLLLGSGSALAQSQDLLARAQSEGTVRVIVSLRASFLSEGTLPSRLAAQTQRRRIARAQNRVLNRMAPYGVTRTRRFRSIPWVAMEVDAASLVALSSDPEVVAIQEDVPVPPLELGSGNDFSLPGSLATSTLILGAPAAWSAGYTGSGQVVAVLDTGVQKTHAFLSGKVVSEACYSTNNASYGSSSMCPGGASSSTAPGAGVNCDVSVAGCDHGTHVAGIAAGTEASFSGVAKDADLIAVQVFSRFDNPYFCGSGPCALSWSSDQIRGLERVLELSATYDIAAVNMSLGGGRYFSTASCDASNGAIKAAIDNLRSVGIATVIASGNSGYADSMGAPGCVSSAVSIGSTNFDDAISWFSNEAPFLSLYAPGSGILSSVPFDNFTVKSGTSMATPHIAGAWAVVKQRGPGASVDEVLALLATTGVPITSTSGTWTTPRPRVDLAVADFSRPRSALDSPADNSVVSLPISVMGWAIDLSAVSGTGVDAVTVIIRPTAGGAPVFSGAAVDGINRPDVAAAFGAQFALGGFALNVATPLAAGSYDLEVSARSVVTGVFDVVGTRRFLLSGPSIAVDAPTPGSVLGWPIVVSGWAVDSAAPSGTGVDAVHVWARPQPGGTDVFLGAAVLGVSRPDVAAFHGQARFDPSGFYRPNPSLLTPGNYMLEISARSTVSGTFDTFVNVPVRVEARTVARIDAPGGTALVAPPFRVAGWALDTGTPGGVGVDEIHVWAFPTIGGSPTFLGVANTGISRSDVAAYFGQPAALDPSGYELDVTTPLSDGDYALRVYVRDTATSTFTMAAERVVSVGSFPRMRIDTPTTSGTALSIPFVVAGWALDLSAPSGTGVDGVHVWAFPSAGGAPTFLGVAVLGELRVDVSSFFGSVQFDGSGFTLNVTAPLSQGSYLIAAYAHSSVAGSFNNVTSVAVKVP